MICIEKGQNNPFFNLAAEEYILKHVEDEVMMLWINEPAVIIGKHQNAMAEVNHSYLTNNNIPLIRRVSGGGAVYHDTGNLNFTLINTVNKKDRMVDFNRLNIPVSNYLAGKGISSEPYGKNNLGINGHKFSGTAAHVFKNRIIHHGTLLYDTNLLTLEQVLKKGNAEITDKAVQSVRAQIINLKTYLPQFNHITEFRNDLMEFLLNFHQINSVRTLTSDEIDAINSLKDEKYDTEDWNYGYSPAYTYNNIGVVQDNHVELSLSVKGGIIVDLHLNSSGQLSGLESLLSINLINTRHTPGSVSHQLRTITNQLLNMNIDHESIYTLLI